MGSENEKINNQLISYPSSQNIYNPLSPSTNIHIRIKDNITALRAGPPHHGPLGRPTKLARRSLAGGAKRRSQTKMTRRSLVGGTKCRSPSARAPRHARRNFDASPALRISIVLRVGCASAFFYASASPPLSQNLSKITFFS